MSELLDGAVAVITGAASGMGAATARTFIENGARVVLADIDEDRGTAIVDQLGETARFVRADVTSDDAVAGLVDTAVSVFGRLDVMYSNAGAAVDLSPIDELTPAGVDRTLSLNLHAHVAAHRYAARQFRAQGSGGSIITTASIAALEAGWNGAAYSMAKAAVMAMVRQAALENAGTGIRCNAILPGAVMTSIITRMFDVDPADEKQFLDEVGEVVGNQTLIGRAGTAQDIANAALFLASDLSSWITGTGITVDGGATAHTRDATVSLIGDVAQRFH